MQGLKSVGQWLAEQAARALFRELFRAFIQRMMKTWWGE